MPLHMHSLSDPPHTQTHTHVHTHAYTQPTIQTAAHATDHVHNVMDDCALLITKSHYSKKPDPPPQRPPYVRPSSAHKAKSNVGEGAVKQIEITVPVAVVEKEPAVVENVAHVNEVDHGVNLGDVALV